MYIECWMELRRVKLLPLCVGPNQQTTLFIQPKFLYKLDLVHTKVYTHKTQNIHLIQTDVAVQPLWAVITHNTQITGTSL